MTEPALEPLAQLDPPTGAATPGAGTPNGAAMTGASPGVSASPNGSPTGTDRDAGPEGPGTCTQAQLRRFIKSRPYVPLHELRRRFGLNGSDDDVAPVEVDGHKLFVGLPARESGLLGELLRQGEVGYELLLDPTSPIIIGIFPMRPVQRP
jgi:hypothetical protein